MTQLDFGLIGNCQVSALIDQRGKMIWACMPDPQSPSVFSHLLDEEKGEAWSFDLIQVSSSEKVGISQEYLKNSAILSTRLILDRHTEFQILDFAPRYIFGQSYHRPPQLIRVLKPIRGTPHILLNFQPKLDYGLIEPHLTIHSQVIELKGDTQKLYLTTLLPLIHITEVIPFQLDTTQVFVLSHAEPYAQISVEKIYDELGATLKYWRGWSQNIKLSSELQREVIRSAITLKLHCFESTGAILAATTTSIPEGPEPGRTWDYRYCWLRDSYFVISSFYELGKIEEVEGFLKFFLNLWEAEGFGVLQPVYGLKGEKLLTEVELTHLSGFKGLGPVRIGNAAYSMKQLDVYGEMLLVLTLLFFDERTEGFNRRYVFEVIKRLASYCMKSFDEPDAGIWEFRGKHRHFLFSKLMMWAGLFQGAEVAQKLGIKDLSLEWKKMTQVMSDAIYRHGWKNQLGYFSQSYSDHDPDAANLLFSYFGFLKDQDPKLKKMTQAYFNLLKHGKGVYRYRSADDFGIPKTSFIVCSFWMAEALFRVGEVRSAKTLFQDAVLCSNHLGLLSEDFDPLTGELWGNFPQCYSHAGLIHAANRIFKSIDV